MKNYYELIKEQIKNINQKYTAGLKKTLLTYLKIVLVSGGDCFNKKLIDELKRCYEVNKENDYAYNELFINYILFKIDGVPNFKYGAKFGNIDAYNQYIKNILNNFFQTIKEL